jgi:hypothetical protein
MGSERDRLVGTDDAERKDVTKDWKHKVRRMIIKCKVEKQDTSLEANRFLFHP